MVLSGTLSVFLLCLLSLSLRGTEAKVLDQNNLATIISYIQDTYGDEEKQFAVAINVPARKCTFGIKADQIDLLPYADAQTVKAAMNGAAKVYRGCQLIGAKPKPIPGKRSNYHSEYLLLIDSDPPGPSSNGPAIRDLLENNPTGCLIFYTFNSPCVNTCSTPTKPYSIIPALEMFKNHAGPKAFVFHKVWQRDVNKTQWEANMKEVNARVPLYRCDNGSCTLCVRNNIVDDNCKRNLQQN
ncbi:uncharacterized protein LOC118797915 [Colossoma macropomum]|uniref:uncharacterized protein LOC118797915 n=1 Tax=Colossoma macropomum TaxID=42526 RepID=UPI001863B6F0|nr:uncharacterized protein LOC118797915 [Colossoma macropomum]